MNVDDSDLNISSRRIQATGPAYAGFPPQGALPLMPPPFIPPPGSIGAAVGIKPTRLDVLRDANNNVKQGLIEASEEVDAFVTQLSVFSGISNMGLPLHQLNAISIKLKAIITKLNDDTGST